MARERLGEILIKAGLLDEAGLKSALSEQHRWGGPLGHYLVQLGLITEETLVRALSAQFRLPAVALDPDRIDPQVAKIIPAELCERYKLICFNADEQKRFVDVAMIDPASPQVIDELRIATKFNVRSYFAAPSAINEAISRIFFADGAAFGATIDLDRPQQEPPKSDSVAGRVATPVTLTDAPPRAGLQLGRAAPPPKPPGSPSLREANTAQRSARGVGGATPPPVPKVGATDSRSQRDETGRDGLSSGERLSPSGDSRPTVSPGQYAVARGPTGHASDPNGVDVDVDDHSQMRVVNWPPTDGDATARLEALVARQSRVIELLMASLADKGLISARERDECERLLGKRR